MEVPLLLDDGAFMGPILYDFVCRASKAASSGISAKLNEKGGSLIHFMAGEYHGPMCHHPKPSVLAIFRVLRWAPECVCECAMVPSPQILQSHDTFGKSEVCTVTGSQTLAKDCCSRAVSGRMEPLRAQSEHQSVLPN